MVIFGFLSKYSFDMVISLAVESGGSYEQLGTVAFGKNGHIAVLSSKFIYSFGCLVAYMVIVKDNFAPAVYHMAYGVDISTGSTSAAQAFLSNTGVVTFILSALIVLPLCLLRHMSRLEKVSVVKILAVFLIILIVIVMYILNPHGDVRVSRGGFYQDWIRVRIGFLESLGTFVFAFVSQHTVHLTYNSLRPDLRNMRSWESVSTYTILLSAVLSLAIGITIYATFWGETPSDVFDAYPQTKLIDTAKLLLCIVMMFTYPLPFFSCREGVILFFADKVEVQEEDPEWKPIPQHPWWLVDGEENQLIYSFHVILTILLWGLTTFLAIVAPSLSDVLDLVGCATGTVIAFILPGLFYIKLKGYSLLAWSFVLIGCATGLVGTYFSFRKLVLDEKSTLHVHV
jgi:sodium-coupled neutral amino acid transporter 11